MSVFMQNPQNLKIFAKMFKFISKNGSNCTGAVKPLAGVDSNRMPHGWHTLDTECKGVLSIGV